MGPRPPESEEESPASGRISARAMLRRGRQRMEKEEKNPEDVRAPVFSFLLGVVTQGEKNEGSEAS